LHKRQRELKEEQERKRAEKLQQSSIHKRDLYPIMEEGAVVLAQPTPEDPKKLKNEELKRKALLIARKEKTSNGGSSKQSSSGLSQLDSETLSN
jgi:hypothetical protein